LVLAADAKSLVFTQHGKQFDRLRKQAAQPFPDSCPVGLD